MKTVKQSVREELRSAEACGFKHVAPVEIAVLRNALTEIERLEARNTELEDQVYRLSDPDL